MSKGIVISLPKSEQDKFRAWVRKQTAETKAKCQRIVIKNVTDLDRRAKISAPVDTGRLRSSINLMFSTDKLGGMVYAHVKYAPYQEFGTGRFAPMGILPGYSAYARQFKGRGVRRVNIYPKMYLFPHFERIKKVFIRDLNNIGFR